MLPEELTEALERALARRGTARLAEEGRTLSARYRGKERHLAPLSEDAALAYAASRMPATFEAVSFALTPLAALPVTSVLDAGAGPGTAAWAAKAVWPEARADLWERDSEMRRVGTLLGVPGTYAAVDLNDLPEGRADLVVSAYVLNEFPEEKAIALAEALWLRAEKALVLVDPGTPADFARMMIIRQRLLLLGAHLAAPCPHDDPCPATGGDWCHFCRRVNRTRLHRDAKGGERGFEDEKFTYLAFTKEPMPRLSRVRNRPEYGKGYVKLPLCTAEGFVLRTVPRSEKTAYHAARDAAWGDLWEEPEA